MVSNENHEIFWYEYYKKNIELKKFKIPELKQISKNNNLHVSGTKTVLIDRIKQHFKHNYYASIIQKYIRRYIVLLTFKLRGPAVKNKSICVNNSDFYTLEPLDEINIKNFYSFIDEGFIYGFHIESLIKLFKKTGTTINPYNRKKIDYNNVKKIYQLYKLSNILFKNETKKIENVNQNNRFENSENNNTLMDSVFEKLQELALKSDEQRIQEIFIEIDLLGNYTNSNWFSYLSNNSVSNFTTCLYEIWNYRSEMTFITRSQICPYYNPFLHRLSRINRNENIKKYCITVLENIVFSGGDIEYRKLGVMHILTALTIISEPARNALPWLYESII